MEKDRYFQMRVDEAFFALIDQWRRIQNDLPSRAEAVRRLIDLGVKADSQIDRLEEDITILRAVATEWAQKAGADQKVIDAIKSDDPGRASDNGMLRKIPRSALLDPQSHVRTLGFRRSSADDTSPHPHPRQTTPKKPPKKL